MTYPFLFGIIAGLTSVIALFFLKFWRKTGDRLFLMFAIAFLLFAVERAALWYDSPLKEASMVYIFRLFAFSIMTYAVVDKNRRAVRTIPRSDSGTPIRV